MVADIEKTVADQVSNLLDAGLEGDRETMIQRLSVVSYIRLRDYWLPFMNAQGKFVSGTTFNMIWARYAFDRRLRLLVFDAIERIEVAVKAQLISALGREEELSQLTFGALRREFEQADTKSVKSTIARTFGVHHVVLSSWLETLLVVRNVVAHHGRLWNRQMGERPKIPNKDAAWHSPVEIDASRLFGVLSICRYCLRRIAPQSSWQNRLEALFSEFPMIPLERIGFPANWRDSTIWSADWRSSSW